MAEGDVSAPPRPRRWLLWARGFVGVVAFVVGWFVVVVTAALGHCSTFGGTCPSADGLHGDVYGGIAGGASLAVAVPILSWRPDRRGVKAAAIATAVVVPALTYVLGTAVVRG